MKKTITLEITVNDKTNKIEEDDCLDELELVIGRHLERNGFECLQFDVGDTDPIGEALAGEINYVREKNWKKDPNYKKHRQKIDAIELELIKNTGK